MRAALSSFVMTVISLASSGTTQTVGPPGSGAPFSSIQAAVDATASGGVVTVLPGTYGPFVIDGKDVDVIAANASLPGVQILLDGSLPTVPNGIRVQNTPSGTLLRVVGIQVLTWSATGPTPISPQEFLLCRNCRGTVLLSNLSLDAHTTPVNAVLAEALVRIEDCSLVVANAVGWSTYTQSFLGPSTGFIGMNGVDVVRSTFIGANVGGDAQSAASNLAIPGGATNLGGCGIRAIDSVIDLDSGGVHGGRGGTFGTFTVRLHSDGRAGVELIRSRMTWRSGEIWGGDGGALLGSTSGGEGAPAVSGDAQSILTVTPSALFVARPGRNPVTQVVAPPIDPQIGSQTVLPFDLPRVSGDTVVPLGGTAAFRGGEVLLVSFSPLVSALSVPGLIGELYFDPSTALVLGFGPPPAGANVSITVPVLPGLVGLTCALHGYHLNPGLGALSLPLYLTVTF